MSTLPLSAEQRSGVLYITFDTPACPVNIFSQQAAVQLLSLLERIDNDTRVLVFRSAKPDSFINGVGLMLASAVAEPEDVPRLTSTVRDAYRAIAELTIPTLAAIRGNCYGCGVELATRFRYRVAADSCDTHFYMTEVADYLFIPTFGGTQYLPRILGIEGATDFLLWGQRWSAREALDHGLIHACFPDDAFDAAVERIAAELSRDGRSKALQPPASPRPVDVDAHSKRTYERVSRLPRAYRRVYSECYELLERAAAKPAADEADFQAEMLAAGRSLMAPVSKAALGFFFVQQLGEQVCSRGAREQKTFHVCFDTSQRGPRFVREELERRRIRGLTTDDMPALTAPVDAWNVEAYGHPLPTADSARVSVAVCDTLQVAPDWNPQADVVLYAPSWRRGRPFVELGSRRRSHCAKQVFRLFAKAGVGAIVTHPGQTFFINDLLLSYLRPQLAFINAGNRVDDLGATLLDMGFTQLPGDWLSAWDIEKLGALLDAESGVRLDGSGSPSDALRALPYATIGFDGGKPSSMLESAILISLLACARRSLQSGTVGHPSIVDVAVRRLLDFPLGRTSLCRYLTVGRVHEVLHHGPALTELVGAEEVFSAKEYAQHGRDFYV